MIADDPKIMETLEEIQQREQRSPIPRPRIMNDEELEEFWKSGKVPQWAIVQAKERVARQEICDHAGWQFQKHGRCCFKCGIIMIDWGD